MKPDNNQLIELSDIVKIGVSVLLFFAGIYFNKLTENLKERRRLKIIEKYFIQLLKLLDFQVKYQIISLDKYLAQIKNPDCAEMILQRAPGKNIEHIRRINHEDIYKIFIERKKGKIEDKTELLQKAFQIVDYYDEVFVNIYLAVDKSFSEFEKYREFWNNSHKETMNLYNKFVGENHLKNINKEQDPFLRGISEIIENFRKSFFQKEGLKSLRIGHDNLVLPLKSYITEHSNDIRASYLIAGVENSIHAYYETLTLRYIHRRFIISTMRGMLKIQRELHTLLSKIENLK
jgi:hypothetical protein